ncbi:helix-turn-helix domain-containing protein [Burkholderia sp. Ac-20353]|uniref:GlxA family transcriptional regulator n=1 Tax=Burkholderia sp. Ac-20353 TaxID=2703894 RepID=UPI00197B8884|nr:helix-turn-helix domain-containing protein [Burkholderia sp. Ac-20353]MBN3788461.1 helix-turn-helix domain-containing protein [Burkholderia sp. Ac-20353]
MATIRIWVYDGILASGVAGPIDVFNAANRLGASRAAPGQPCAPTLTWRVESVDGQPVRAASGQTIAVDGRIDVRKRADAILVTAPFVADMDAFLARRELVTELSAALRRQHDAGALLASYCTGSYLLAEAGLLDDRIATTHWSRAPDFRRRYPLVELRAHQVLTEQSGILCGGAVTSYLDMAVRVVERLTDAPLAALVAKTLLIDAGRASQASYASLVDDHGHTDPLVARAQRRMEATLRQRFRLADLAAHLAVSERTLNRRFRQAVGDAPLGYLQRLRVEVAKRLLESGVHRVEAVCEQVGYDDLGTFRQLFKRMTGLSPREYQQRFARSLAHDATDERVVHPVES